MRTKQYHHGDLKKSLIQAGMEILAEEGVGGLSLRKAATRAGVSHSAPYAHFTDKQDLIAAISTEGFRQLLERWQQVVKDNPDDMAARLVEVAWAYVQFARENTALFKTMFSGLLEMEQDYPDFVDLSHQNFLELVELVRECQKAGLVRAGGADRLALSLWSLVHGFVSLLLEKQFPSSILKQTPLKSLLCQTLNEITLVELTPE
ncbi:MAG: TetR/AcrR family transcriptional regulator [Anaerolineaceae bacterium]